MTPFDFFHQLVARYEATLPENPSEDDVAYFSKMKIPTQKRYCAFLLLNDILKFYMIQKSGSSFNMVDQISLA